MVSSQNARKHGFYSTQVLLADEDRNEHLRLVRGVVQHPVVDPPAGRLHLPEQPEHLGTGTDALVGHRRAEHEQHLRWGRQLRRSPRGVTLTAEPRDHRDGSRSFYCLDPDGLRIQVLYEPTLSRQSIA